MSISSLEVTNKPSISGFIFFDMYWNGSRTFLLQKIPKTLKAGTHYT